MACLKTTAGMPLCRYSEMKFREKTEPNCQNVDVHLHFYFYWKSSFPQDIFRYQQTLELGILLIKTSLQVEIFILTELLDLNLLLNMSQSIHQRPIKISQNINFMESSKRYIAQQAIINK